MSENRWYDVDGRLLDEVRALDGRELDVAVEDEVMGWSEMDRRIVSMGLGDPYGCYLAWAVLGPRSDHPATLSCLELAAVRGSGTD